MTDVKDLVLTLVRPLVNHPEQVSIEVTQSEQFMEYNLSVAPDDIGRVIGKQGRVVKAIRTIVYSIRTDEPKKVRLNILEHATSEEA
ncbi:RNA-binding protein [Vagococcus penaei]|uniref:RNA-binding protein KhpA n=1 Tax=Vagococcus penaei TaxID=633807 RepID=A0A1Q2D3Z2_9ENTE|nr:KH domain-containing protein [Vagococcus penaei]AQP53021.1 RNA-binding protein [Vagococcus penaei]RSU06119.1 RNA-binding protein [Vagococcus penaei]